MTAYWALYVVAAMSLATFMACVADKRRARRGARRIRERTLLTLALAGGSPGLLAGMLVARHKVRRPWFLARLLAIVVVQAVVVWWLVAS